MPNNVTVELNEELFLRLQLLATPLVDTTSTVIERILNEWEQFIKNGSIETKSIEKEFFKTKRGVKIPCGKLRASYRKQGSRKASLFSAEVTKKGIKFNGNIYDDPSPAGLNAKKSAGAIGSTASTNGWEFWEYYDEDKKEWIRIDRFRKKPKSREISLMDIEL